MLRYVIITVWIVVMNTIEVLQDTTTEEDTDTGYNI